ncbi:hypothetical protein MKW94_001310 [Papaver nudicaule]|uniref:Uncharacterized protein n=1 Tax=Papaver nudicaule TaxID=74823 RepID=A0AA41SNK5_PAPNU|nr:hypothetical protein [Papaver nudicaule]
MANTQTEPTLSASAAAASGSKENQLLAGYLAHEFLTEGTLFGQKWDAARAEANPINPRKPNVRRPPGGAVAEVKGGSMMVRPQQQQQKIHSSYPAVANLLRSEGAHIEGIVNPTQLARWLQM